MPITRGLVKSVMLLIYSQNKCKLIMNVETFNTDIEESLKCIVFKKGKGTGKPVKYGATLLKIKGASRRQNMTPYPVSMG